jgi:hypothetical protein
VNCSSAGLVSLNQPSPNIGQATRASKSGKADPSAKHGPDIAGMDLIVDPTMGFKLLYGFLYKLWLMA